MAAPGTKLQVSPGKHIRVDVEFIYQGPKWDETLYSALYEWTWYDPHNEVSGGAGAAALPIPYTPLPTKIISHVVIPVPNRPGETFGIYAKLGNILSRYWDNVIEITEAVPAQYTLEVSIEPPATGYVTKSPSKAKYSAGEKVTLVATPYSGYEFDHWGGWPTYPSIGYIVPVIQITMDVNRWVVAAFRKVAPPPPPPPPTVYICPQCGAEFASEAGLSYHIQTAHPPAPLYRVTFTDGSTGIFTEKQLADMLAEPLTAETIVSWVKV